jgi:hypothetical protein
MLVKVWRVMVVVFWGAFVGLLGTSMLSVIFTIAAGFEPPFILGIVMYLVFWLGSVCLFLKGSPLDRRKEQKNKYLDI